MCVTLSSASNALTGEGLAEGIEWLSGEHSSDIIVAYCTALKPKPCPLAWERLHLYIELD